MKRKIHYVSLINQPEPDPQPKKSSRTVQVIAFSAVLLTGMIISLIIPIRPTISASEKRELAKFPKFSVAALINGDYFEGIDTWFSDTFPFREALTGVNTKLTSWYGFGDKVSSMVENTGDDIPDIPTRPADNLVDNVPDTTETLTTTEAPGETTDAVTETTTEKPQETASSDGKETTAPQPKKTETLGGVLIAGKAAYEYYNFVQSTADKYIKAVNRAAKHLDGKAKVYDMLIPTSIDITLDDATRKSVSSDDQFKAMTYFYGSMNDKVKTVYIYDVLKNHRKEYIYYRTDHHWTALGAYYAYVELAKTAGKEPVDLKKFEEVSYGRFLGSFYGDTKKNKKLEKNADELIAYQPYYSTTLEYTDNRGNKYTWPLVNNVSAYNEAYKYSSFAAGDQPFVKVTNNDIEKGAKCVVIKESFGNAVIPFLAGNYKKVYVLDYRYWKGDLYSFIKERGVSDVYFLNNMSATRNAMLVEDLNNLTKEKKK